MLSIFDHCMPNVVRPWTVGRLSSGVNFISQIATFKFVIATKSWNYKIELKSKEKNPSKIAQN